MKSNSARSKEFRAKRKKYENELGSRVAELRAYVTQLDLTRDLMLSRGLHAVRFSSSGALANMIHEPEASTYSQEGVIHRQEQFLRQVMDEDAIIGDFNGPQASIDQWRRYTSSHDDVWAKIDSVSASGTQEHPTVELRSTMHARISTNTFRLMFPGALHRRDLQQKFLHRSVSYQSVHHFEFTQDGKIAVEIAEFDFVQGLLNAGFPLQDIADLMNASVITPHCLIPDPAEHPRRGKPPGKLSVEFLLTPEEQTIDGTPGIPERVS